MMSGCYSAVNMTNNKSKRFPGGNNHQISVRIIICGTAKMRIQYAVIYNLTGLREQYSEPEERAYNLASGK